MHSTSEQLCFSRMWTQPAAVWLGPRMAQSCICFCLSRCTCGSTFTVCSMQACHPSLNSSKELQLFLEMSEDEFAHEVARAQMEQGSAAKKTLASTLQLFRDIGHSTANLMSGKHDDEEEDPDYIKVSLVSSNRLLTCCSMACNQSQLSKSCLGAQLLQMKICMLIVLTSCTCYLLMRRSP